MSEQAEKSVGTIHMPRAQHLLYHSLPKRLRVGISKASKAQLMLNISWFTGSQIHVKLKWGLLKIQPRRASSLFSKASCPPATALLPAPSEDSAALPTSQKCWSYLCEVQADVSPSLLTKYQDWELLPVDTALAYSASLLYSYNSATAFGDVCAYTEK